MSEFYQEMQEIASELLAEFSQDVPPRGPVSLVSEALAEPVGRPWDSSAGVPASRVLDAVARAVEARYVDGARIVGNEIQVTFAVPDGPEPTSSDRIVIGDRTYVTVDVKRIPAAGLAVAWVFIVRG